MYLGVDCVLGLRIDRSTTLLRKRAGGLRVRHHCARSHVGGNRMRKHCSEAREHEQCIGEAWHLVFGVETARPAVARVGFAALMSTCGACPNPFISASCLSTAITGVVGVGCWDAGLRALSTPRGVEC